MVENIMLYTELFLKFVFIVATLRFLIVVPSALADIAGAMGYMAGEKVRSDGNGFF